MTKESLYSAKAYKKVLFFTLIKISIFFCFTAQIQGETDDFDYCRNSYEMYALNLSDKNTLEATETCIQAFESKFIGIEEYLERLESFGSGLENSDLYLYNKYKFECTFYDGLNKKIDCKSLKNLFLEQTKNGVDTYLYELYHDESIIRENLEGEWEDNYLNLRDSAISDESRDLIKKIGSFNCEFFDEFINFDYRRYENRLMQARYLYHLSVCAEELESTKIYKINQLILDFLDTPYQWSSYYEDALIVDTSHSLTNNGPNSSYHNLNQILKKRFNLEDLQYSLIERWYDKQILFESKEENTVTTWAEDRTIDKVLLTFLNFSSLYVNDGFYEVFDFEKDRNELIKFFGDDLSDRERVNLYSASALTSLRLLRLTKGRSCEISQKFALKALDIINSSDDIDLPVIESFAENLILLSNCFMTAKNLDDMLYDEKSSYSNKHLESSLFFLKKADFLFSEYGINKNIVIETFSGFLKEKYNFHKNLLRGTHIMTLNLIFNEIIENERALNHFIWGEMFEDLINSYTFHFNELALNNHETKDLLNPASLYEILERLSNVNAIKYSQALNSDINTEIAKQFSENQKEINFAESKLKNELNEELFKELDSLYVERQNIIQRFYLKDKKLKDFYDANLFELNKFKENLKPNEAIINFQASQSGLVINLTTQDGSRIFVNQFSEYVIKILSDDFRESLINGFKDNTFRYDLAYLLYQILFEEVDSYLGGDYTIYLYGNEFDQIPFHILISEEQEDYKMNEGENFKRLLNTSWLIDRYNFLRIYPIQTTQSKTYKNRFLGIANSKFKTKGLSDLPNVKDEVKFLALASQSNENLLFDKDATKKNFKTLATQNFERIVIATHTVEPFWKGLTYEPSIVFNDDEGDFMLSASEISMMNIDTDMVVLSSCNTELEDFNSIYKAFLVAGSNSVLYTHWELDTKSAPEITESFFKKLWFDPNVPKHESLRQTLLEMKSDFSDTKYAHPSFWGNFTLAYGTIN